MRLVGAGSAAIALLAAASAAVADDFSWQVSAAGEQLEIGDSVEMDRTSIGATYYFHRPDDARGPLALAAYLSRSSYVGLAAHRDEESTTVQFSSPISGTVTSVSETETQEASILGRYVFPGSGWYAGGSYLAGDGDPPSSSLVRENTDIEGYGLHAGKYLGESTSLELAWRSTDSTTEIVASGCIAYPFCLPIAGDAITVEEASVGVIHVGAIGRLGYSVSGSAASRRTDLEILPAVILEPADPPDLPPFGLSGPGGFAIAVAAPPPLSSPRLGRSRRYSGAFDVFPSARLGVGTSYARWDGDRELDDRYDITVEWFFLRNLSARFAFARQNRKTIVDEWRDIDTVDVALTGRF